MRFGRSANGDEERRALLRRFLWALPALVGCIPVQSVVGRPAAVLSEGDRRGGLGGGGVYFESASADGDIAAGFPYPYLSYSQGLGNNVDWEIAGWIIGDGTAAGQLSLVLRQQVLGHPYVLQAENEPRTEPLDLSLEIGGSITGVDTDGYADFHLGVNASAPLPWGAIPYVSYRYHWGILEQAFEMHMLFAGVEFTLAKSGARVCVEVFHGFPPERETTNVWRTWGFNAVYRTVEF